MALTPQLTFNVGNLMLVPAFSDQVGADTNSIPLGPSLTVAHGQIMAQKDADGLFYPYNSGASDGTQNARRAFMVYDCTTDGDGLVTLGDANSGGTGDPLTRAKMFTAPAYYKGAFRSQDLTGLSSTTMGQLSGAQVVGDLTTGIVIFG